MDLAKLIRRFRVERPDQFTLIDCDPADTGGLDIDKTAAKAMIGEGTKKLSRLQETLYADGHWAVLVILQGMDTAGKDGVIEHVLSGVNPQGCEVHAFKPPNADELDHDFLWRAAARLPRRGKIGIFNRSYYEECLVVRVHPEFLERQKLPPQIVTKNIWQERFEDIRAFERHLVRNGTLVLKFHLRISKQEQARRLLDRLDDPSKRWKFNKGDIAERELWDQYMAAYEDMIRNTSTSEAAWHVVPADHKWFARLVTSAALVDALERLDLKFPSIEGEAPELKKIRQALAAQVPAGGGDRKR
ncbi:MAG: polyphosphate kinase 2 family protein [Pseudomonadota bacterium]|nr:polyphosphate kinase 2 family protein [Pseudomonadota bacterium]